MCTSKSAITTKQFVYSLSVVNNENVFSLILIFLDHEVHVQAISEQKNILFPAQIDSHLNKPHNLQ